MLTTKGMMVELMLLVALVIGMVGSVFLVYRALLGQEQTIERDILKMIAQDIANKIDLVDLSGDQATYPYTFPKGAECTVSIKDGIVTVRSGVGYGRAYYSARTIEFPPLPCTGKITFTNSEGIVIPGLKCYIPIQDINALECEDVEITEFRNHYAKLYPNGFILDDSKWNKVIEESKTHGWNPALVLALWGEESGFSDYETTGAPKGNDFGCGVYCKINRPQNFEDSLDCFMKTRPHCSQLCDKAKGFFVWANCYGPPEENPYFIPNLLAFYRQLVPDTCSAAIVCTPRTEPPNEPIEFDSWAEDAINWAKSKIGSHLWDNYCLRFVANSFRQEGPVPEGEWDSALEASRALVLYENLENAPRGTLLFFSISEYWHVGIYLGEGKIIHAFGEKGVRIDNVDILMDEFEGWAYPPEKWKPV